MLDNSAYCSGEIRHWRRSPNQHQLSYPLCMTLLNLREIEQLDSLPFWSSSHPALIRFKRTDYLDPDIDSLEQAVLNKLEHAGITPDPLGDIQLLTQLRSWGFSFNPVSFYFCYDYRHQLYAIIAEITNTPWRERHAYVLPIPLQDETSKIHRFQFKKAFHVSPFMPMEIDYDWQFKLQDDTIEISMLLSQQEKTIFSAQLTLQSEPLTSATALKTSFKYPAQCLKTLSAIYWNAFRLWLKRTPFYAHPTDKSSRLRPTGDSK